jgi:hypothetical protein
MVATMQRITFTASVLGEPDRICERDIGHYRPKRAINHSALAASVYGGYLEKCALNDFSRFAL